MLELGVGLWPDRPLAWPQPAFVLLHHRRPAAASICRCWMHDLTGSEFVFQEAELRGVLRRSAGPQPHRAFERSVGGKRPIFERVERVLRRLVCVCRVEPAAG